MQVVRELLGTCSRVVFELNLQAWPPCTFFSSGVLSELRLWWASIGPTLFGEREREGERELGFP